MKHVLAAIVFIFGLIAPLPAQEVSQSGLELKAQRPMVEEPERAPKAMIASANQLASEVGLSILRKGGNAVDAAVAVAFALAVVHPEAGNIGGGGFLLLSKANGEVHFLDFREKAPKAASHEMYLDRKHLAAAPPTN